MFPTHRPVTGEGKGFPLPDRAAVAKVQVGNSWELSSVPYIPAVENVARHAKNLRDEGVDGAMLSWTLGGYPSPAMEVFNSVLCGREKNPDAAMNRVACRRFGDAFAPAVVEAWKEFSKAFADSIQSLNAGSGDTYEINIANSLWGDTTCKFQRPFTELINSSYNGGLKKVDFINASESARIAINTWVEEQTRDRIPDLIPQGGVTSNTRLALVNAVYFKGFWSEQFDEKLTQVQPFHLADGATIQTPLMKFSKARNLSFFSGEGIKVIELDYRGDAISMIIILPDKADGLADLEANLTTFQLQRWLDRLEKQMVMVHLPRFSMHWGAKNIVPDLRALGMRDAFISKVANFSGIDGSRDLLISGAFHKAFIDVNEEGTEAAAATGIVAGVTSMPPPPEIFRADRPFLFLIREKATKNILFMGRLTEPDPD